ncbi:flagellar protein FlaG [Pseudomonas sp. Pseusp122]|uniref:flagellar protein FlaG n=1 Tax=unclassified Pseudomonas TaxID=196821 RepID=UPI0039A52834
MDMSTNLNLSYPVVKPVPVATEQPVATPQVASAPVSAPAPVAQSSADSSESNDSKKEAQQSAEKLKAAVQEIDKFVKSIQRNLEFSIDEQSGKVVVKVIASDTGEVVRQLPSAEALKIADSLQNAHSLLFEAKA